MARRRKSSTNSKTRETNVKGRSVSTGSASQEDEGEENNPEQETSESSGTAIVIDETREEHLAKTEEINEKSKDKMMPLDIQQMILGDLQSVGQSEEIIVSRENAGDVMEEECDEEMCESGTVVESPREEEYEIQTEEEEEDELIFMNEEDDGEENQYVIVVNSNFDTNDDADQEVVSFHDLSDLQEGSCEIITVVRESDYDSSQESLDGMDEDGCDNINAVIGTLDGIHCVKISQYNSEDESSNHDDSIEEKEIKVTELEAEVACISSIRESECINIQNFNTGSVDIDKLSDNSEQKKQSIPELAINAETTRNEGRLECTDDSDRKSPNVIENMEGTLEEVSSKSKTKQIILEPLKEDNDVMDIENSNEIKESYIHISDTSKLIKTSDVELTSKLIEDRLNISSEIFIRKPSSDNSFSKMDDEEAKQEIQNKPIVDKDASNIDAGSKNETIGTNKAFEEKELPNVDECPKLVFNETINSIDKQLAFKTDYPVSKSSEIESSSKKEHISSHNLQEDKGTSNINENAQSDTPKTKILTNVSGIKQETSPVFDNILVESSTYNQEKTVVKGELVVKDEEGKQHLFRSRSGSTDTTGSESGSNSSSSRRRSGRIKSISVSKHVEIESGSKSTTASSVAAVTSTTTPPVPGFELDKPVKVKSRWRRSSELEMGSGSKRQLDVDTINTKPADSTHARSGQPTTPPDSPPSEKELGSVLTSFQHLDTNEYRTDRSKSKDAKRMVCDCMLTKEELARGDMGCGEDCLNRLLMIECGARCMLGERCANKRFQNLEYAKSEVFKTELKGYGIKALENIPEDTFILEYVGEVLDPKEFRRRAKDYAKDKNLHFYFMALKSDSIIDATQKGNISRFINHSCDPNAETQKWTVNGELRVGFFSKRPIVAGEEITFDYKYQRYGKEAQRCYCKSTLCRGWIGEDPEKEEKENKVSDGSSRSKERREKKKKEDKKNIKDILNDIDLEEEIEKLVLKNRAQTLMLCRLIVRAEDHGSRMQLLSILQKGETACQRLFLDYHGLRLVWSWMMDPASNTRLKIEILETLAKLPIPNKTMLQDSKVLGVVEKWSSTALTIAEAKDRSSTEEESDKTDTEKDKQIKGSDSEKSSDYSNTNKFKEPEDVVEKNKKRIVELANDLLKEWSSLKEVFRIPKKERIEQMKEHEREADKVYSRESSEKHDRSYDRHRNQDKYREYDRRDRERDRDRDRDRKRGRDSPDSDRSRKSSKPDDRQPHLTKMERRQLFAIKAAQEEEDRQRRQQECMWQEQVQLAAHELAQAQAQAQQEMNYPPPHPWMSFPPGEPNGIPPHMEGQSMFGNMNHTNTPPPFLFNQGPHLHQHPPFLDPIPPFHNPVFSQPPPLPKQPLLPTPNQPPLLHKQPLLPTPPLPGQPHPRQPLLSNPHLPNQLHLNQPLLPTSLPNQLHPNQPLLPTPPLPNQPHPNQPLLLTPPLPNQPLPHQPLLTNPPLPNQPYPQNQSLLSTAPPLPAQPYALEQTLLPNPPLPNQPHPLGISHYNSQPPLPNQPQPITSQLPPATPVSYPPQEVNPPHQFQSTLACTQNQFTQPPPFTVQPPLPSLPPAPSPQPVYQNSVAPASVPVTSTTAPSVPVIVPTPVPLPPKWKSAKDPGGRTYYYHVKTRVPQWEPPIWELQKQQQQTSESESDSSDSSDDDSSSEDEEQQEEKINEEEPEPVEEVVANDDDLGFEEMGDSPYEPETMEMFEDIVEDTKKRRTKDNLVQERIISPRTADEIPEKLDKRKIRELKEKLRRQKAKEKLRLKQKNKSKGRSGTSKCEADTSSEPGRKIKEAFRLNMAGVIVNYLNVYRKPECKCGKITNTEDFKHLARKLTHFVMLKELKHCRSVDELECNDNVKHKAKDFIKKYMSKFSPVYQRRDDD